MKIYGLSVLFQLIYETDRLSLADIWCFKDYSLGYLKTFRVPRKRIKTYGIQLFQTAGIIKYQNSSTWSLRERSHGHRQLQYIGTVQYSTYIQ